MLAWNVRENSWKRTFLWLQNLRTVTNASFNLILQNITMQLIHVNNIFAIFYMTIYPFKSYLCSGLRPWGSLYTEGSLTRGLSNEKLKRVQAGVGRHFSFFKPDCNHHKFCICGWSTWQMFKILSAQLKINPTEHFWNFSVYELAEWQCWVGGRKQVKIKYSIVG